MTIMVERVDLLERESVFTFQQLHVPELVDGTLESIDNSRVLDHSKNRSSGFLQRGGLLDGLLAEVVKVCAVVGTRFQARSVGLCFPPTRRCHGQPTRQSTLDIVQMLDLVSELLGIVDQVGTLGELVPVAR